MGKRGDFFCLLIITLCPPLLAPCLGFSDRHGCCCVMPASCPCGRLAVFGGFIWDHRLVLACPPRRASSVLPLHGTPLVMSIVPIVSLIVLPYGSSSPLAPSPDTPGGEGCLLPPAVPFMSARRDIIRHRFSSNRSSPRLLAPSPPHTHQSWGSSFTSDCGERRLFPIGSPLSIRPSVPFMLAPFNRHGERGERRGELFPCLMRSSGLSIPSIA